MLKDKFIVKYNGGITYDQYFEIPEECPHCGKNMAPSFYYAVSDFPFNNDPESTVAFLFKCVLCRNFFTRMFLPNQLIKNVAPKEIELSYNPPIETDIPEKIKDISKEFPEIYTQALTAKQAGLNQIYGMGLRKALEFLVKDFAIYLHTDKTEDIKEKPLGYVIDHYFDEFSDITALFKAATWIGNDETHYERKHPNKDAETIKRFISVTMSQISSRLTLDEAVAIISNPSKS